MVIHDKAGKPLEVGQYVDLQIQQMASGLVVDVRHAPLEVPGQGLLPPCVTIQIVLTIPAGAQGGVWCYVVKDAPKPEEEKKAQPKDNVSPIRLN